MLCQFVLIIIAILPIYLFSDASSFTREANESSVSKLSFSDTQDFEDASRGYVAAIPDEGVIKNAKGEIVWDLQQYQFLNTKQKEADSTAPLTINPSLWRQARLLSKTGLFQVCEGIYQVRGADISNMTIIEGKKGVILIDPLLSKETARVALDLYFEQRSKKPIQAVIYTHSHGDHFGGIKGVLSEEEIKNGEVQIIAPQGFTEAALSENVMAGNVMGRRALYMYGSLIQPGVTGQVTSGLGLTTSQGEMTFLSPTHLISKTGQKMTIDGISFVFLMAPGSEAPAEMLFYLPEKKALCAAEDATHTMHNLYTLRGAKIRDAKAWASYLNESIDMFGADAEIVFAQHHWPRWGNSRVVDFLEKQRDLYKFIHDQSLHFANQGLTMTEIGEKIRLPAVLAKEWYNRGYYGSLNHNAKSVYVFYLGWFNGNPSTLHILPETEAAKKYVEYMGGGEAILAKAKGDYDRGNYRWTAQVLNHLVFADPANQKAKNLLADTLEQLGYQAENATWRNFYLTGAKELRLGVQRKPILALTAPDMIEAMPVSDFLDYLAIRLDGIRAAEEPLSLNVFLADINERYLIQVKNGVLNYFAGKVGKNTSASLSLNKKEFYLLFMGLEKSHELIDAKKMSFTGSLDVFQKFQNLLDTFDPWFNIIEPLNL